MNELSYNELKEQAERLAIQLRQMETQASLSPAYVQFGSVFSEILHELNQPLSSISNFSFAATQLLSQSELTNAQHEDLRGWVANISNQAQRVAEMVQRLRILGRSSASEQSVYLDQVIAKSFQKSAIPVKISCTDELRQVNGDCGQLEQVLLSLVKIMSSTESFVSSEKCQVEITIKQVDAYVELTVSTKIDGPMQDRGIAKDTRLEVAICRWIILSHGGMLYHETQDNCERYRITLPSSDSSAS